MTRSWSQAPIDRPSFEEITKQLFEERLKE
jgi:hypothetical protein